MQWDLITYLGGLCLVLCLPSLSQGVEPGAATREDFFDSKLLEAVTVLAVSGKTSRERPEAVLVCLGAGLLQPSPVSTAPFYSI